MSLQFIRRRRRPLRLSPLQAAGLGLALLTFASAVIGAAFHL